MRGSGLPDRRLGRAWPLVAVAGGVAWALCFDRHETLLAPWLALVPLFLLLDRAPAAAAGLLHGLAYWLVSLVWIQPTLTTYGGLSSVPAALGLFAVSLYLALYSAAFTALGARLWRRRGWPAALGLPALWVALETVRGVALSGFPWNLAGYSLVGVPGALPLAAWGGVWSVSFLVVAVNGAVARSLVRRDWRQLLAAAAIALPLLAAATATAPPPPPPLADSKSASMSVRLLQPNPPIRADLDPEAVRTGYAELLRMTEEACAAGPALILWPESAAWPFSYQRHAFLRRDLRRFAERGCPVLLNSAFREGGELYNAVLLVTDDGAPQRYDKRHLVPFGEYVPLAEWLPFLQTVARGVGGFSPGNRDVLLNLGEQRMAVAICFEIVFPGEVARRVRRGATLLVTVTNDGWYGDSSAPWQHFRAARFRAAENRLTVLRAAITGVSGIVDGAGRVRSQLGVGEAGMLTAEVRVSPASTLFNRWPWLVPAACWILLAFAIFSLRER